MFTTRYEKYFQVKSHNLLPLCKQYITGLVQSTKRNMERMVESVPDSDWQVMQHFLTYSPWDYKEVNKKIAQDTDKELGQSENKCLLFDETYFAKKGKSSVGVARQWNGRLGKIENSQVGVFATLAKDDRYSIIDNRLYLPREWTKDKKRMEKAKVPIENRAHKTKLELAIDMVDSAIENKIGFNWIGADGFYGNDSKFIRALDSRGLDYLIDIHSNRRIYAEEPKLAVPQKKQGRGRKPTRLKPDIESIRVDKLISSCEGPLWETIQIREGTKGTIKAKVITKTIWLWDDEKQPILKLTLVVSKRNGKTKYSVTNINADAKRLAYIQNQRYWVERSFQDAKSETGMDEYQVRNWLAWHHHMTLVMMAMLFMLEVKNIGRDKFPLLSAYDIRMLLALFLPKRTIDENEVFRQMEIRHKQRKQDIEYAKNKKT